MKRLLVLLLICMVSCAQAEGLTVEPYQGGFSYTFLADDAFVVMKFDTDSESAQRTLYSATGRFEGELAALHTFAVSPLAVSVETLDGKELLHTETQTVEVPQASLEQNLTDEAASRKLYDMELTPLISAVQYAFRAPGHASLTLKFRSATERGATTIYAGDDFVYTGILALPYTYNNSNVVLTVANSRDTRDLYEEMLRTDYPITAPPVQGTGKLSGITVCIDPGHQETARFITEKRGPGLSGTKESGVGMARGTVTRRMESIVVLEIGFLLRDALLREGAAVVMTRETQDTYLSNTRRAEIAAEAGADFFLRLHCDLRDKESIQGIGIFCPYGSDYAKAIASRDEWEVMGDILLHAMQAATGQNKGRTATTNQFIGNNWALMPSFLIEMGYMSNPEEDILLSAKPYQQMLVDGMVNGIYELAVYRGLSTI